MRLPSLLQVGHLFLSAVVRNIQLSLRKIQRKITSGEHNRLNSDLKYIDLLLLKPIYPFSQSLKLIKRLMEK